MPVKPKRGSALAKILRTAGTGDAEVERGVVEYTTYWLGRLGGLRHVPAPTLALLDSQKLLLRALLSFDRETADQERGGVDAENLKLVIPVSNSLRLGEVRLERLASGAGTGETDQPRGCAGAIRSKEWGKSK